MLTSAPDGNNYGCIYDQANMDNIKYAFAAGHEVASHGWNHIDMTQQSSDSSKLPVVRSDMITDYQP